jgi:K+-transporting ATPase ATPase A chain
MLLFVIVAVFIAGLMVGRTPEYLGKKVEAFEMKMASIGILVPNVLVLVCTALAVVMPAGTSAILNPGPHGFTEILYAFSSMANNNGSAFGGLHADNPFYNLLGAAVMLFGRYWVAIPALAVAGSLAAKRRVPVSAGTLPTDTPLFVVLLIGTILLVGALTHLPGLALGPIVEHLMLGPR